MNDTTRTDGSETPPVPIRLLWVEDHPGLVRALQRLLRAFPHVEATFALDGSQALKLLEELRPSAVVLDMQMAGISGLDVLRHMRQDERTRDLPVVVVSGCSDGATVDAATALGIRGYLHKPAKVADVFRLLDGGPMEVP